MTAEEREQMNVAPHEAHKVVRCFCKSCKGDYVWDVPDAKRCHCEYCNGATKKGPRVSKNYSES